MKVFHLKKEIVVEIFLLICIMSHNVVAKNDLMVVGSVEFQGLKYLSKFELAERGGIKSGSGGLVVNKETLVSMLSTEPLVKSYQLQQKNKALIIKIEERNILAVIALTRDSGLYLADLTDDLQICPVNRVRAFDKPLVHLPVASINDSGISESFKKDLKLWLDVSRAYPELYGEISDCWFQTDGRVKLKLHKRPTEFVLEYKLAAFDRLNALVALLDAGKNYPGLLLINEDRTLYK